MTATAAAALPGRPPTDIPAVAFLELARLDRYLSSLFRSEEEQDCVLGNRALSYVSQLIVEIEAVRPEIRKGRAA